MDERVRSIGFITNLIFGLVHPSIHTYIPIYEWLLGAHKWDPPDGPSDWTTHTL